MNINNIPAFKSTRYQQGAVLFTALIFMILLTMLAITSMSTNTLEEKMAANSQENNYSFQAADSSLKIALDHLDDIGGGEYSTQTISDFDGNGTTVSYLSAYEQTIKGGVRCETEAECNEAGQAISHYDVSSTSTTSTGLVTVMHAGVKQVGG